MMCTNADHARFHSVMFATNGCLACELEATQARVRALEREVAELREDVPQLGRNCLCAVPREACED